VATAANLPTAAEVLDQRKRDWMQPITAKEIKKDRQQTKSILEAASYRFDLEGDLVSFPTPSGIAELKNVNTDKSIDPTILYHHGDEPTLPGTLQFWIFQTGKFDFFFFEFDFNLLPF